MYAYTQFLEKMVAQLPKASFFLELASRNPQYWLVNGNLLISQLLKTDVTAHWSYVGNQPCVEDEINLLAELWQLFVFHAHQCLNKGK